MYISCIITYLLFYDVIKEMCGYIIFTQIDIVCMHACIHHACMHTSCMHACDVNVFSVRIKNEWSKIRLLYVYVMISRLIK